MSIVPSVRTTVARIEEDGQCTEDIIGLRDEELSGEDQLRTVIYDGTRVAESPDLDTIRATVRVQCRKLPEEYRRIEAPETYSVTISDTLRTETDELQASLEQERDR